MKKAAQEPPVNPDDPNLKMIGAPSPVQSRSQSPDSQAMFYPELETVASPMTAEAADSPSDMAPSASAELPTLKRTLLTNPKHNGLSKSNETARRPPGPLPEAITTPIQNTDSDLAKQLHEQSSGYQSPQSTADDPQAERQIGAGHNDLRHRPQTHGARLLQMAAQPEQPQAIVARPPTQRAPAQEARPTMRGKNGRSWAADEVVVHLSLGDYNIGPVKLAGYPTIVRAALINYKRAHDASVVEVHFAQENVLNPIEYQTRALDFVQANHQTAGVIPFDDTAKICGELAHGYLIPHDLSAVWVLNSTTPLAFVLYSPRSSSWLARNGYRQPDPSLNLSMKAFKLRPGTIASLPATNEPCDAQGRKLCQWKIRFGNCKYGNQCFFSHEPEHVPPPATEATRPRAPLRSQTMDERDLQRPSTFIKQEMSNGPSGAATTDEQMSNPVDGTVHRRQSMSAAQDSHPMNLDPRPKPVRLKAEDPRLRKRALKQPEQEAIDVQQTDVIPMPVNQPVTDARPQHGGQIPVQQAGPATSVTPTSVDANQAKPEIDWSPDLDLDWNELLAGMSAKPSKHAASDLERPCAVFVGLPVQFGVQAAALNAWAEKHTKPRLVCGSQD
jgi:hypothetical protein